MNGFKSIFFGKYTLWLLLAVPGIMMSLNYSKGQFKYDDIMHITGEFAGRMLIISLIATPISLLFPKTKVARWLLRNRRFFGVAAFAYTLLHTIFYLLEYPFTTILNEAIELSIVTGWIAFFVFIPLAMTSTNAAVKRMGRNWKKLQQWAYLAAIMAFAHWALLGLNGPEGSMGGALAHFVPVMLLQVYRVWKQKSLKKILVK